MLQYNYSFDEKTRNKKQTNGSTILSNTPIQRRRAAAPSSGGSNGGSKMDSQFDSLKREATKLERNLEDKVARYQQVSLKGILLLFLIFRLNLFRILGRQRQDHCQNVLVDRLLSQVYCDPGRVGGGGGSMLV